MIQTLPASVDITYYPDEMFFRLKHTYQPYFFRFMKSLGCIYENKAWTYWFEDHDTILKAVYKTFGGR